MNHTKISGTQNNIRLLNGNPGCQKIKSNSSKFSREIFSSLKFSAWPNCQGQNNYLSLEECAPQKWSPRRQKQNKTKEKPQELGDEGDSPERGEGIGQLKIKDVLSTAVEQLWRVTLQIGAGGWRGPGTVSPEKQEMECRDYLMYLTVMRVALQLVLSLA